MNAFSLTAVVTFALFALSAVLFAVAWFLERTSHVRAVLMKSSAEILLCCFVGLLLAIAYYLGLGWDADAFSQTTTLIAQ